MTVTRPPPGAWLPCLSLRHAGAGPHRLPIRRRAERTVERPDPRWAESTRLVTLESDSTYRDSADEFRYRSLPDLPGLASGRGRAACPRRRIRREGSTRRLHAGLARLAGVGPGGVRACSLLTAGWLFLGAVQAALLCRRASRRPIGFPSSFAIPCATKSRGPASSSATGSRTRSPSAYLARRSSCPNRSRRRSRTRVYGSP